MFAFNCVYNQKRNKIVGNVKDGIEIRGGRFDGDLEKGTFSVGERLGLFSGNYQFTESMIKIEIKRKPFYMTKQYVQEEVSAYFERQLIQPCESQKEIA